MISRGPLIAALVLLALCGVLYWSNHRKPEEPKKSEPENAPAIFALDGADITKIEIKKKSDPDIVLSRAGAGEDWQITAPERLRPDQETVSTMASYLSSLDSERVVENNAAAGSLSQYGLADPGLQVSITAGGNKFYQVDFGDDTPTRSAVYAKLQGDSRVFTVASYVKTSLDKKLADLQSKKLFSFGWHDPDKIEIYDGAKIYFLVKGGDDWWSGDGKKLDSVSAETLLNKVRELEAASFPDSGFTKPLIEITATSNSGKRVEKVLISKSGEQYIARREGEPALYQLKPNAVEDLQKAKNELKNSNQPEVSSGSLPTPKH